MTTLKLKTQIKRTKDFKLNETKKMFEMGLLTPQERFLRDFEANNTYKKEMKALMN